MKRSLWLIFAALALIAAGVLLQYPPDTLAVVVPAGFEERQQRPEVRIQHEFVTVTTNGGVAATTPSRREAAEIQRIPIADHLDTPAIHRTVRADAEGAVRLDRTVTPPSSRVTAPSPRRPAVQRASDDGTLLEKARRAFVGDGRYRPEPFPRVR